jgi:hypothetical protein
VLSRSIDNEVARNALVRGLRPKPCTRCKRSRARTRSRASSPGCWHRAATAPCASVWLQKYESEGNQLWPEPAKYGTEGDDVLSDMTFLPDGRLIAVGATSQDPFGQTSIAWANLYQADGSPAWPRPYLLSPTEFQDPLGDPDLTLHLGRVSEGTWV